MNISDLSYLERVVNKTAIHGGIAVTARVWGTSTGNSASVSTHVQVTSGTSFLDGSWANSIVSVNVSGTGGDFTGNVEISGLTDAHQVILTEAENEFSIVVNPINVEAFVSDIFPPLIFEPLLTN
ncbi:hypothetical protein [Calothrix sp. NIES-2098]|uniref:hypothetical protein n=1 Tax=Calothrix sp. NIES-2098 TaxID=1954171 RepID=UPI000B606F4C|nr:hypothetical protein NIES2098_00600 [Calothrix sp. NIES-2098]